MVVVVVVVVSGLWSIWFVAFIVHLFFCSLARFHTQNFIKRPPKCSNKEAILVIVL
ncbi:hypothetical protein MEM_00380 [Candida albicans L26]|nr:hypothetical protein MEM_00380 [Candida albicans L26]